MKRIFRTLSSGLFVLSLLGVAAPAVLAQVEGGAEVSTKNGSLQGGEDLKGLLHELGSPDFETRSEAAERIEAMGRRVVPKLRRALEKAENAEARWQIRRLLRKLEKQGAKGDERGKEGGARTRGKALRREKVRGRRGWRRGELDERISELETRLEEMRREIEESFPGMRGFPFPKIRFPRMPRFTVPGGNGISGEERSMKVEIGPRGVRVEIREKDPGGKTRRKVYEAEDMDSLLEAHPELRGKIRVGKGGGFGIFGGGRKGLEIEDLDDFLKIERFPEWFLRGFGIDLGRMFDEGRGKHRSRKEEGRQAGESEEEGRHEEGHEGRERKKRLEREEGSEETGRSEPPRLGVYVREEIPPALREYLDLEEDEGLWIQRVLQGSLAERIGLRRGDILLKLNGKTIASPSDVARVLRKTGKGERVKAVFLRKGRMEDGSARL